MRDKIIRSIRWLFLGSLGLSAGSCRSGDYVDLEQHESRSSALTSDVPTDDGVAIYDDGSGRRAVPLSPVTRIQGPPPSVAKPPRGPDLTKVSSKDEVVAAAEKGDPEELFPLTIVLDELPTDWVTFRKADRPTKDAFVASRLSAHKTSQASLLAWLTANGAQDTHSSWLVNVIDTRLPAKHIGVLAKRLDVKDLSPKSDKVEGARAWGGRESQDATRLANFKAGGFNGHAGGRRNGGNPTKGRIRIAVIEQIQGAYANWPLVPHPGWKRADNGGPRIFVRDCATSACLPTTASQSTDADNGATHGSVVSWVAGGSIEHGQDASYPGAWTADQRLRSGHLEDSYILYYMANGAGTNGDAWAIDKAVQEGADVINISSSLAYNCDRTQNPSGMNERIRAATDAGVVVVAAGGNFGSGGCTIAYPAVRPEVIAVNGLESNSETTAYDSLTMLQAPVAASRGGMPIGLYGGGSSTIAGIDLVAPGKFTYNFRRNSIIFPPLMTYGSESLFWRGSSFATPVVSAAAGAMRNAFESIGWDMLDARMLMANVLLMGDGWNADSGYATDVTVNSLSGAGRLRAHFPQSPQDFTAPWGWGWRSLRIYQGDHMYFSVGHHPMPPSMTMWKAAILWTPSDLNAVPDIDFYIEDTCAGNQTVLSDAGYDIRARFRIANQANLTGRCLRVHAYGYSIPPGGVTFYVADYFHSGPTNVH